MGLKYTKRAMTSYEVHRFFHGLEISFFPDTYVEKKHRANELLVLCFLILLNFFDVEARNIAEPFLSKTGVSTVLF